MAMSVTAGDVSAARPYVAFTSLRRLSRRGILVWATALGRGKAGFAEMTWPPRLSAFRVDQGWEGQPAPNVQQRVLWGVVNGFDMDVRVYFGTQHPDRELLRMAQAQLARLVLPSR